ncbi:GbNV_gp81-like [Fopius arisanus]|nr:GbNV_gp81-like [Fopius arisanus]
MITIDSNVSEIIKLVVSYLFETASEWCTDIYDCKMVKQNDVYYNTPISKSFVIEHPVPDDFISFIYLDFNKPNDHLDRIIQNMSRRINKTVVISNANVVAIGTYHLMTKNCNKHLIAEAIATIINTFKYKQKLLHPVDIEHMIFNEPLENFPITENMVFDVHHFMEKRNQLKPYVKAAPEFP